MFISDMITACSDNVEKKKGIIDVQLQDKRTNGLSGLCLTNGSTLVAILIGRMRFIQQTIQFFFLWTKDILIRIWWYSGWPLAIPALDPTISTTIFIIIIFFFITTLHNAKHHNQYSFIHFVYVWIATIANQPSIQFNNYYIFADSFGK